MDKKVMDYSVDELEVQVVVEWSRVGVSKVLGRVV